MVCDPMRSSFLYATKAQLLLTIGGQVKCSVSNMFSRCLAVAILSSLLNILLSYCYCFPYSFCFLLLLPCLFSFIFSSLSFDPNNQASSYPLSSDRRRLVVAIRSCSVSFRIVDIRILRRRYSQLSYRFVVKLPVPPRRIVYKLNAPRIIPRLTNQSRTYRAEHS
jgi:hypothetical protein